MRYEQHAFISDLSFSQWLSRLMRIIDKYFGQEVYCDVLFNSDHHMYGDLLVESLLKNFTDKLDYYVDNDDFEKPLVFDSAELLDKNFLPFLEKGMYLGGLILSFSKNMDDYQYLLKHGFGSVEQGQFLRFEISLYNNELISLLDDAVVKNTDDAYLGKESPWEAISICLSKSLYAAFIHIDEYDDISGMDEFKKLVDLLREEFCNP